MKFVSENVISDRRRIGAGSFPVWRVISTDSLPSLNSPCDWQRRATSTLKFFVADLWCLRRGCLSQLIDSGRRGRNRTCNHRIRNPVLYPFELRAP